MEYLKTPIGLVKKLNGDELLLLSIIHHFRRDDEVCYKSNTMLCDFLGWSSSKLGRILNKLKNGKYIKITLVYNDNQYVVMRKIRLGSKYNKLVGEHNDNN